MMGGAFMGGALAQQGRNSDAYVQVDWISSDGYCGIVTDYCMVTDGARVDAVVNYNRSGGYWYTLASVTTSSSLAKDGEGMSFALSNPYNNGSQLLWVWWDNGIWSCYANAMSANAWHSITVYKDLPSTSSFAMTTKVDGQIIAMSYPGWTSIVKQPPVYPLTFFCRLPSGQTTPAWYFNIAKLRRFTVYTDIQGTNKGADFIPVVKATTAEAGLLDTVSGKFYGKIGPGILQHGDPI